MGITTELLGDLCHWRWLAYVPMLASLSVQAQPASSSSAKLAEGYNTLGFRVLNQLATDPARNVFISPAGLSFALGLVQGGAAGRTRTEMDALLQSAGPMSSADLDAANHALIESLAKREGIKLEVASSLWTQQAFPIKPDFANRAGQVFSAEARSLDFRDPASTQTINAWASEHTHGKIPDIVKPPLDPRLRLIVLNAIYFKGSWAKPFPKDATTNQPFHLANGTQAPVPRMKLGGDFSYFATEDFQAVRLSYAGGDASMLVFLPAQHSSLAGLLKSLTPEHWRQWRMRFGEAEGTLELPRFKMENRYELNAALQALGMKTAFSEAADFSLISTQRLNVDDVLQKTFVEVNEEGTEAAAVTKVGMKAMGMRMPAPKPHFDLVVDRPFLVAIVDSKSEVLLFLGAIADPR